MILLKKDKRNIYTRNDISVLFIVVAVVGGILLFKYRTGRVEPIQYKHQDKIDEKVWEMEPDDYGKREVGIALKSIPKNEIPNNINPKSPADMAKLYDKRNNEFLKRNSVNHTDISFQGRTVVIMYADEKLIRKIAEDELVTHIFHWENGVNTNQ